MQISSDSDINFNDVKKIVTGNLQKAFNISEKMQFQTWWNTSKLADIFRLFHGQQATLTASNHSKYIKKIAVKYHITLQPYDLYNPDDCIVSDGVI